MSGSWPLAGDALAKKMEEISRRTLTARREHLHLSDRTVVVEEFCHLLPEGQAELGGHANLLKRAREGLYVACADVGDCSPSGAPSGGPSTRWGTVVVAAYDSAPQSKTGADFVAPGPEADGVLTEALELIPSGGGELVLLEGTYVVTGGPKAVEAVHTNIRGMGAGTLLVLQASGVPGVTDPPIVLIEDSSLAEVGVIVTGSSAGGSAVALTDYSQVKRCRFEDCGVQGDTFSDSARMISVCDNVFTGVMESWGLVYTGSNEDSATVCRNRFHDVTRKTSWEDGDSSAVISVNTQGVVSDNTFSNVKASYGIYVNGGGVVQGNHFVGYSGNSEFLVAAIFSESSETQCVGNQVEDALIGIDVSDDPSIAADYPNNDYNAGGFQCAGIQGYYGVCADNLVRVQPKDELHNASGCLDVWTEVAVAGNQCLQFLEDGQQLAFGLHLYVGAYAAVTGNRVSLDSPTTAGIWLDAGDFDMVTGNVVSISSGTAYRNDDGVNTVLTNNI
jgi:hypothetical protein